MVGKRRSWADLVMLLKFRIMSGARPRQEIGFTMSARIEGLQFHERLEVVMVPHVDDLRCSGPAMNLEWVRAEFSEMCGVKGRVMMEGKCEIKCLGWVTGRNERGFHWEEDTQHRNIFLEEWGLECCNGVSTPAAAQEGEENKVEMQDLEAPAYRRSAAH